MYVPAPDPNILNVTIFVNDNFEAMCNNLPSCCKNLRIIIESRLSYEKMAEKYKNINLSNLPVTTTKIDIIFKGIYSRQVFFCNTKETRQLLKDIMNKTIKVPFDCELNIIFL